MQPIYYLPNLELRHLAPNGVLSRAILAERGLQEVWRDVEYADLHRGECPSGGPDKQAGLLLAAGDGARARYEPDKQTWHQLSDVLWVGIVNDAPPTPLELQRKTLVHGHLCELQGNAWVIPVLRSLADRVTLPRVPKWVNGTCMLTVRKEWQALWQKSARMWDIVTSPEDGFYEEILELTADVMAANYRIDRALQGVLEILDTLNWEAVLRAAVDWPAVEAFLEAQKKSGSPPEAGLASTTPGDTAETTATPPVAENCISPVPLTETSPLLSPSLSGEA